MTIGRYDIGKRQLLGLIGSIVLFLGVFAPIVSIPIRGNLNYFQNGKGDGVIVLILAIASFILAINKKYKGLWYTGLGSLGICAFTLLNFHLKMSQTRAEIEKELANNLFKPLADLALGSVQLEWGWALLVLGAGLVVAAAAVKELPRAGPVYTAGEPSILDMTGEPPRAEKDDNSPKAARWSATQKDVVKYALLALLGVVVLYSFLDKIFIGSHRAIPAGTGKWQVNVETNPIDDSKTVVLMLAADSGKSKWGNPVLLGVRCRSKKTDLMIRWGDYLGSETMILTRVGNDRPISQEWSISTDKQATFYPGNNVAFIRSLLPKKRLVAQVTPYNESPVTAVFDLTGLPNVIKPVQETCSWR